MLTTVEKVIILQDIDFFEFTPTEGLAMIAAITEELNFKAGTDIFTEGEAADSIYMVVDGQVRLHRSGQEIATISEKEGFGTLALFDDEPRFATATAASDTYILKITKDVFLDIISDHVSITESVFKSLVKRIRSLLENRSQASR